MIAFIITCLWLALIPFCISLLIDLSIGTPAGEEPNEKAIFFGYSCWMAKNRLNKYGMYRDIYKNFENNLKHNNPYVRDIAKESYRKEIFETAKPRFTWELGFFMCPICSNVRLSIIFALIVMYRFDLHWICVLLIPIFSNLYMLLYQRLK